VPSSDLLVFFRQLASALLSDVATLGVTGRGVIFDGPLRGHSSVFDDAVMAEVHRLEDVIFSVFHEMFFHDPSSSSLFLF